MALASRFDLYFGAMTLDLKPLGCLLAVGLFAASCVHDEPEPQARQLPGGVTAPRALCKNPPRVPGGETATVVVSFVVRKSGQVDKIELVNADAPPVLFEAVKSWLTTCRFAPALDAQGNPITVKQVEPFEFHHVGGKSFPGEN